MKGESKAEDCIVFTGGGSGGHIYPGLAVIERLRETYKGRIVWLGSHKASDRATVEAAGIEYLALPSGKLRRSFSLENLLDVFKVLAGYFAARRALKKLRPRLLFSKGGYVSVPPCRAAASLGIPVFTHESDLTPGLATRLNARVATKVLVSYEETLPLLSPEVRAKAVVVGNPIRPGIRRGDGQRGRAFLGAPQGLPVVFFMGGSQGARQVNDLVAAILPELCQRAFVVHQTGEAGGAASTAGLPEVARNRYRPYPYIREEMADVLAASDLIVGRAGAGFLWEAGALGKPMVLVPLCGSGTRGDQVDNARLLEARGGAKALVGPEASPEALLKAIDGYLSDPQALEAAKAAITAFASADAARLAADLILA